MAKKSVDYSTPDGIRAWLAACAFTSDSEAAKTLGVPFRTFCRYKNAGLPRKTASAKRASTFVIEQMQEILQDRKQLA